MYKQKVMDQCLSLMINLINVFGTLSLINQHRLSNLLSYIKADVLPLGKVKLILSNLALNAMK